MPELPDITIYVETLRERILGRRLRFLRCLTPYVLRSIEPPITSFTNQTVTSVERLGKRIAIGFEPDTYILIHLMISGRLQWTDSAKAAPKIGGKLNLALFEFEPGWLTLTEASTHKRATLHTIGSTAELDRQRPNAIEPLDCTQEEFASALARENRTLKRALTNPKSISGIGNAYSDEILHAAKLSPLRLTKSLESHELERLYLATRETLLLWIERLRSEFKGRFPGKGEITAFRPDFAAHGKFGKPCPVCQLPIQRIQFSENEMNYCANCQNEGRVLADRSLSRLLKDDWPKTIWEMVGE